MLIYFYIGFCLIWQGIQPVKHHRGAGRILPIGQLRQLGRKKASNLIYFYAVIKREFLVVFGGLVLQIKETFWKAEHYKQLTKGVYFQTSV